MEALKITEYLLFFLAIWTAILTFLLIRSNNKWQKIIRDGKKINIVEVLENINARQINLANNLTKIGNELSLLKSSSNSFFQKFSVARFNPFENTGGDQSFIIALLNGQNDGFIISSLHSRSGTRVYAKQVSQGKAATHQFSKEEKEIVEKTARLKASPTLKAKN